MNNLSFFASINKNFVSFKKFMFFGQTGSDSIGKRNYLSCFLPCLSKDTTYSSQICQKWNLLSTDNSLCKPLVGSPGLYQRIPDPDGQTIETIFPLFGKWKNIIDSFLKLFLLRSDYPKWIENILWQDYETKIKCISREKV